jgi:hypothetical protein
MHHVSDHYAQRIVGRLFSRGGRLHLIVDADSDSGLASVTCRVDETTQVISMPISECIEQLANSRTLKLDGLNARQIGYRVVERDDAWFLKTREGQLGPFADRPAAERALTQHVLLAQEEGRSGRPVAPEALY